VFEFEFDASGTAKLGCGAAASIHYFYDEVLSQVFHRLTS